MFSRTAQQVVRRTVARGFSTEASATPTAVKLNFALPHETIYNGASVYQVIIPGVEGEYGVTANHVPYVAQLKPGVLQILHEEIGGGEPEKYFVAGGYALTHDNSTTVRSLWNTKMICWNTEIAKCVYVIDCKRWSPHVCHVCIATNSSISGCCLPRSCEIGGS